jgi:uncharacterized protein (TIGR02099 family)
MRVCASAMKSRIEKLLKRLQPHLPLLARLGRKLLRAAHRLTRFSLYPVGAALVALAVVFVVARIYLPELAGHKAEIEEFLSERSAHKVRIENLSTYWEGLSPGVYLEDVQVFAPSGTRPAVRLEAVRLSVAPLPLLWGEFRIERLRVIRPRLAFERLADGRYRIAGLEPLEAGSPEEGQAFLELLFRQHRIEIEDGEFAWRDHRYPEAVVRLAGVDLGLRNDGNRHRLDFSAVFPDELCRDCRFTADVTGNPFASEDWDGEIYLRAGLLDVSRLPGILRERLPERLHGRFALELWSEWEDALPEEVNGKVSVSELRLPLLRAHPPLAVREARARLDWRARGDGWRLDLEDLALALTGPSWNVGKLRLQHESDEQLLRVQDVRIGDLTQWVAGIEPERAREIDPKLGPPLVLWRQLDPQGRLSDLKLQVSGPWDDPQDFDLEADVTGLKTAPHGAVPGVENLSGHVTMAREKGEFLLDSRALKVDLRRHFRAPLAAQRVTGRLAWAKKDDHWHVTGEDLELEGEDGSGKGKLALRIPHDPAVSPHFKLRVDFRNGNGAHAARYYPVHDLKPDTLAWMERAFVSGRVVSGHLIYEGPIREFPFRGEGQGRFEIAGQVRDAVYDYLPGWEPITQVQAEVLIRDRQVLITGAGRIGTLKADQVRVQTAFGGAAGADAVRVSGRVQGPVAETLRVLRAIKGGQAEKIRDGYLPAALEGQGDGTLLLGVTAPFADKSSVAIRGEYRVAGAGLKLADSGLAAEALQGSVHFTENGPQKADVHGKMLGGDTHLTIDTPAAEQWQLAARGLIRAESLAPVLGEATARRLTGAAAWNARFAINRGVPDFQADVDLPALRSELPAPFHRPQRLADSRLVARSESASRTTHVVILTSPGTLNGRLMWRRESDGWRFERGRLALFDTVTGLPPERGLSLRARLEALDVDQWLALRGSRGDGLPPWLTRVSADVRALDMFDRRLGAMNFDLARSPTGWAGAVQGTSASGRLVLSTDRKPTRVELDLAHLVLPETKSDAKGEDWTDPRDMPYLAVRAQKFTAKGRELGAVEFTAEPITEGWRITRAHLARPEATLDLDGEWRFVSDGTTVSSAKIVFRSSNAGQTFAAFGFPDQLAGGEVEIDAQLAWPGALLAPRATTLDGRVQISAKKGSFLQLKQGAGRLFGLVDITAIGRYLTLDFTPVFGKGFVYDRVGGTIAFERGNAYTQDLSLKGPSAHIAMNGRLGLAAEDFDLTIGVEPQLSTAVTLGSWYFLGPQVAAGVLAAQQLFKKQIAAGTRVTYVVKGSWEEPNVTRTGPGPAGPEESGG